MISCSLRGFLDKCSWGVLASLYLNLVGICTFTITCSSYIPTVSYLASFRNHDVLIVLTWSFYFFSLLPLFAAFNTKISKVVNKEELFIMIVFEIAILVLGLTCGLIDEINGIEFNPIDNLHVYLSFALSSILFFWVYYALHFLERTFLVIEQKKMISFCWKYYQFMWLLYLLTLLEWHFAYTTYNGLLANTLLESVFEWALISLSLRFPVYFSEIIDYSLSIYQVEKKNIN
jgi:hypothetical protein